MTDNHPALGAAASPVTALIPVKTLASGKSRLSGHLTPEQRVALTEETLRRLLHILRANPRIGEIAVVTRDPAVIQWLHGRGVTLLPETRDSPPDGLNAALRGARAALPGAMALLVLPADLVAVTAHDIAAMIGLADAGAPSVVIAPDRLDQGTNALLLRPPGVIDFAFGERSAARHAAAAAETGAATHWYRSDSIALDLDAPEDYDIYTSQW